MTTDKTALEELNQPSHLGDVSKRFLYDQIEIAADVFSKEHAKILGDSSSEWLLSHGFQVGAKFQMDLQMARNRPQPIKMEEKLNKILEYHEIKLIDYIENQQKLQLKKMFMKEHGFVHETTILQSQILASEQLCQDYRNAIEETRQLLNDWNS